MNFETLLPIIEREPNSHKIKYAYGTAGFRMKNNQNQLNCAILRATLLACVRSQSFKGQAIGIMITASHNKEPDNGAKICDPDGGMLAAEWEKHAVSLANANEPKDVVKILNEIVDQYKIDTSIQPSIYVASDTRKSSPTLYDIVSTTAQDGFSADVNEQGILTTPQLHHVVREKNSNGIDSAQGYYRQLFDAFNTIANPNKQLVGPKLSVFVDCAFGVGSIALSHFLKQQPLDSIELKLLNEANQGDLNEESGAEYVQKQLKLPINIEKGDKGCFASLDGDADRIVFFGAENGLQLCDGDKIAALIARFVLNQLNELNLKIGDDVSVGVVQTAYANGASTTFIRDTLKLPVSIVKTGVKYLHHKAQEYDIGVYFEANGHGTVLFSENILKKLNSMEDSVAKNNLIAMSKLANQAVGDAIGDLLLVAALLMYLLKEQNEPAEKAIQVWSSLYNDLQSRQGKVSVKDRSIIKTTADETKTLEPEGLQDAIDVVVKEAGDSARAFVRPSGTEDIVRTYAEAPTRAIADELESKVAAAVKRIAGGV